MRLQSLHLLMRQPDLPGHATPKVGPQESAKSLKEQNGYRS
jgi:hypothetical protein